MYLITDESGTCFTAKNITESDLEAVDSGIIDIVDIETNEEYYNNNWHTLNFLED